MVIENKVNATPSMATLEEKILISHVTIKNWNTSKGPVIDIFGLISYLELREAPTIVKLALLKANMRYASGSIANREWCCVEDEFPGPAQDAVLQCLSDNGPR